LGGFIILLAYAASLSCDEKDPQEAGGTCVFENGMLDPFCVNFNEKFGPRVVILFILLMYFWTSCFFHAFSMFTTAYAAGVWYYSPIQEGRKMLPDGNTFCDFKLMCRGVCAGFKHVGSFAMGSLIMAICKLLVFLLKWAKKKDGSNESCYESNFRCVDLLSGVHGAMRTNSDR